MSDSGLILPGDPDANIVPFRKPIQSLMTRSQERKVAAAIIETLQRKIEGMESAFRAERRAIAALVMRCDGRLIISKEHQDAVDPEHMLAFRQDAGTGIAMFFLVTPEDLAKAQADADAAAKGEAPTPEPPEPIETVGDACPHGVFTVAGVRGEQVCHDCNPTIACATPEGVQ